MDDNIIPFGKYKGKPVEVLASDRQYMDWLLAQSWFKEKNINLYNVVINNFRVPVDTPEHNKLQIKFLNDEYRLKLAFYLYPHLFFFDSKKINAAMHKALSTEDKNKNEYFLKSLQNPSESGGFGLYTRQLLTFSKPIFEKVGIDVRYSIWYGIKFYFDGYGYGINHFHNQMFYSFLIEIKPTVSDDYPAVLRQMKATIPVEKSTTYQRHFPILLVGEYTGIGATKEEFVEFFKTQGYIVVFEHNIDQVVLPEFEREFILDKSIEEQIHSG